MKIKVLVTSLILGATLTAGVTVAASAFESDATPVAAARDDSGNYYYYCGQQNGWSQTDTTCEIKVNGDPVIFAFEYWKEFKFMYDHWGHELSDISGTAASSFDWNNGNRYCKNSTTTAFAVSVKRVNNVDTLYIDNAYIYHGTDTDKVNASWGNGSLTHFVRQASSNEYEVYPSSWTLKAEEEFKLTNGYEIWGTEKGFTRGGSAGVAYLTGGGSSNFYVSNAGTYKMASNGTYLYFDLDAGTTLHYNGTKTGSWADDTSVTLAIDGAERNVTFIQGEEFGFKVGNLWINYDSLNDGGTWYGAFGKNDSNNNLVNNVAGTYSLKIIQVNHELKLVIKDIEKTIYVLDKYNDKLNTSHNAYWFYDKNEMTSWPGKAMDVVGDYSNIYSTTGWEKWSLIINNGTDQTGDLLPTDVQAGKTMIINSTMTGTSFDWVSLDAAKFISKYMHFQTIRETDQSEGTACKGNTGYYKLAKDAYALLDGDSKEDISGLVYVVERLQAWAKANGETFTVTNGVGAFSASAAPLSGVVSNNPGSLGIIIVIASISGLAIIGYFLFKRKRAK